MIAVLFTFAGARHDEAVNRMSQFNQRLAFAQVGQAQQYSDYRDKGYVARSHGHVAYRGANLPQALLDANRIMSPQRVSVEWLFEKMILCAVLFLPPKLTTYKSYKLVQLKLFTLWPRFLLIAIYV